MNKYQILKSYSIKYKKEIFLEKIRKSENDYLAQYALYKLVKNAENLRPKQHIIVELEWNNKGEGASITLLTNSDMSKEDVSLLFDNEVNVQSKLPKYGRELEIDKHSLYDIRTGSDDSLIKNINSDYIKSELVDYDTEEITNIMKEENSKVYLILSQNTNVFDLEGYVFMTIPGNLANKRKLEDELVNTFYDIFVFETTELGKLSLFKNVDSLKVKFAPFIRVILQRALDSQAVNGKTKREFQEEKLLKNANSKKELDKLIGLKEVKEQVEKICDLAKLKSDMVAQGKKPLPISLNMVFKGNPGTAKTTVARILAHIFYQNKILDSDEIVEVGRADLVGKHTGETAKKVKSVFELAEGKILFIDEAYALVDWYRNGYADEAISTIIQEMENRRDRTIVIFAGYPEPMDEFLSINPGLKSRVQFYIDFSDYSIEELTDIAEMIALEKGFSMDKKAKKKVAKLCDIAKKRTDFGNGRFCRNLVESAIMTYADRIYGDETNEDMKNYMFTEEDFNLPEEFEDARVLDRKRIGFLSFDNSNDAEPYMVENK